MMKFFPFPAVFILIIMFRPATAQNDPYYIPESYHDAVENGTRTPTGVPGSNYWVNHADYSIDMEVDPETGMITGSETIQYYNNSPDSLDFLVVRLYQNIYKKGNPRQFGIGNDDLTEGVEISKIEVNETGYDPSSRKVYMSATNMYVRLNEPLLPGLETKVAIDWSFRLPQKRWIRFGQYNKNHLFAAYWYPQIAVYDDIDGWDQVEYAGMVEYYNDLNDFKVNITAPADFVIWATGELQNSGEVFREDVVEKINIAKTSDEVLQIIAHQDYESGKVTKSGKSHTWKFVAEGVPDFAFAASSGSAWDAVSLVVEPATGRRVLVSSVYPDSAVHYEDVAMIARNAVEYMSYELPGYPFPWPQTTVFANGRRTGGMEFPMMANDGAPDDYADLQGLTFHEILHNYFPFYLGTNERKYAFMDEGWARYLSKGFLEIHEPEDNYFQRSISQYESVAGSENELPPMIPTYIFNDYQTQRIAAYTRPAVAYYMLHTVLGDELYKACMDEYISRWKGKHPMPYDFFNTFEAVAGEDLTWFWKPWFFERGYPDLSIKSFTSKNILLIERKGLLPVPVEVKLVFEDGTEAIILRNARIWSDGQKVLAIPVAGDKKVKEISLGSDLIPDVNRLDNYQEAE